VSDELEMELVKTKIRVFVLEELLLSQLVATKRGGGGLTLKVGQDQARAQLERSGFEIGKRFYESEFWKELPEPKHLVAELVQQAISDLASRVGSSNG
jgi:hypothetical protein